MSHYPFYVCKSCGKTILPEWIEKSKGRDGWRCRCGGMKFSPKPTGNPLSIFVFVKEILHLIFHPWRVKETIVWPSNWPDWKKFFLGGEE